MPAKYAYDTEGNILHTYHSGILTVSDFCHHFQAIIRDNKTRRGYIEVVHLHEVIDFAFTSREAVAIIECFQAMHPELGSKGTIFIGPGQLQFGLSRIMKSLHEIYTPDYEVRVAKNSDEAEKEIQKIKRKKPPAA
ncbi:MAG: hypothetical protein OEV91_09415 [Desulfobulbaceae bacterium]|nr:hypothetical protein [Desulfobulbaceae bacterium]